MREVRILGLLAAAAAALWAQAPTALMTTAQVGQLCERSSQLMEAGGVSVPELQRASGPIIENARQACVQLKARPDAGQPTFLLMTNLRAYLTLSDAVPKPFPFPETARQQFAELRDNSNRLDSYFRALLDQKDSLLRNADRDNLARYAEANRRLPAADPARPRVVFFGDSITDFWRLNEYFPDRDFVNRGIAGQITAEMLGQMKADVIDLHPAAVVILAGTNDLARGIPLTAIENDYAMLTDLALANKIKVIFASVLPVSDYHKDVNPANERTPGRPLVFIKALNEWLDRFCSQRGCTYLNYHQAMIDSAGQLQSDISDDGLHPNSKGYRIMAPLVLEAVQKTLTTTVPAKPLEQQKPPKRHLLSRSK